MLNNIINSIAQEGIADLIDKDILLQPGSPLRDIVLASITDELSKSIDMIKKLDTALKNAKQTGSLSINFDAINDVFIKNAGHMPGRVMGKAIQQYGKLSGLLPNIQNPFNFFYAYNEAAKLSGGALPLFSNESIDYLKQVEGYLMLP